MVVAVQLGAQICINKFLNWGFADLSITSVKPCPFTYVFDQRFHSEHNVCEGTNVFYYFIGYNMFISYFEWRCFILVSRLGIPRK